MLFSLEYEELLSSSIFFVLVWSCLVKFSKVPENFISNLSQVLAMSTRATAEISSGNDSTSGPDGDSRLNFGDDDENMVSDSKNIPVQGHAFETSIVGRNRDKHLRYRTRVFAAEYVILLYLYILLTCHGSLIVDEPSNRCISSSACLSVKLSLFSS